MTHPRVLHVDCGREMRGGQWQVLHLVTQLAGASTLLAPAASPLLVRARRLGLDARALTWGRIWLLSREAGLAHAHDARAHSLCAALARCPLVVARRVSFPVKSGRLSRWKYGRASHYIAVSEHVKGVLAAAGVRPERTSVVHDGVELPPELSSGGSVVAPASADPLKGQALAAAAARLAGIDIEFSDNLARDLPRASVFIYLSAGEGLGSAALLAMAHGVPVVASRVGGLPEIVRDGQTGVLTENEPAAVAQAIRRCLALREELRVRSRQFVEQGFTTAHMAAGTAIVYARVLGRYN